MPTNPITPPLPADLPTDWVYGQIVAPAGTDVGLSRQHGYNYLMEQVNAAQAGVNTLGASIKDTASLDGSGKLEQNEIPNIDCGVWDTNPVAEHNGTPVAHQNLLVDGNRTSESDTSETLEEHMANPNAHQNLTVDGNAGK